MNTPYLIQRADSGLEWAYSFEWVEAWAAVQELLAVFETFNGEDDE